MVGMPAAATGRPCPDSPDELGTLVVRIGALRPALWRGMRLLAETVVIPTLLLYACVHTVGTFWGLVAVLGWCALTVCVRGIARQSIPSTLLLSVAMLVGRTSLALAFSSIYVFLLQPVIGSLLMAVLFLGSAAIGRPVTLRLAQDFIALPSRLVSERAVRKMFTQVSLLWGGSRVLDAVMSVGFLHWGVDAGLLSRGMLSTLLTVASVALCAYWGWTRLRRLPGITISLS